jgi:hypothetical protein
MTSELMKEVELEIAKRFLEIYNSKFRTSFQIVESGEAPDISCQDDGIELYLEITVHENLEGDIRKEFERIKGHRQSLGMSQGQRGNLDNILENLKKRLEKKLQASYSLL